MLRGTWGIYKGSPSLNTLCRTPELPADVPKTVTVVRHHQTVPAKMRQETWHEQDGSELRTDPGSSACEAAILAALRRTLTGTLTGTSSWFCSCSDQMMWAKRYFQSGIMCGDVGTNLSPGCFLRCIHFPKACFSKKFLLLRR